MKTPGWRISICTWYSGSPILRRKGKEQKKNTNLYAQPTELKWKIRYTYLSWSWEKGKKSMARKIRKYNYKYWHIKINTKTRARFRVIWGTDLQTGPTTIMNFLTSVYLMRPIKSGVPVCTIAENSLLYFGFLWKAK